MFVDITTSPKSNALAGSALRPIRIRFRAVDVEQKIAHQPGNIADRRDRAPVAHPGWTKDGERSCCPPTDSVAAQHHTQVTYLIPTALTCDHDLHMSNVIAK